MALFHAPYPLASRNSRDFFLFAPCRRGIEIPQDGQQRACDNQYHTRNHEDDGQDMHGCCAHVIILNEGVGRVLIETALFCRWLRIGIDFVRGRDWPYTGVQ